MHLCTSRKSSGFALCMYVIRNTVVVYGVMSTGEYIRQYSLKYVEASSNKEAFLTTKSMRLQLVLVRVMQAMEFGFSYLVNWAQH